MDNVEESIELSDIYLVSYLISCGKIPLKVIFRQGRGFFIFPDDQSIKEYIAIFFSGRASVVVSDYIACLRQAKRLLRESAKSREGEHA